MTEKTPEHRSEILRCDPRDYDKGLFAEQAVNDKKVVLCAIPQYG